MQHRVRVENETEAGEVGGIWQCDPVLSLEWRGGPVHAHAFAAVQIDPGTRLCLKGQS
jgi:hypothetical protein